MKDAPGAPAPQAPPARRRGARAATVLLTIVALLAGATAWVAWRNLAGEGPLDLAARPLDAPTPDAALAARGEYLVRAGSCYGCHTARGGVPYAGGRPIETPFGIVHSSNLTPDRATGIGAWSADAFWRALHHGRSRDGRLLYPVFPYPNYTRITRADSDAMHAWFMTLPRVVQPNKAHVLGFPVGTQAALAVWRALYFRPDAHADDPARPADWNRGAYLVEGLGHCNACHSARNALGATRSPLDLAGGMIPMQNWYAPSLTASDEAGVAEWPQEEIVRLLKTGIATHGFVMGPMAEVVQNSTQHLADADLAAMASYLRSLPPTPARPAPTGPAPTPSARGAALYADHCAGCHGRDGRGVPGAYPPLAGNRAVTLPVVNNLVHAVLEGGFPPATAGNPRPYGMPPYASAMKDDDLADLLSHIRNAWGNRAPPVSALEVAKAREGR